MSTIAVTGATGRLGANLVAALLDRGHAVRGLVIPDDPKRGKMDPFDVDIVEGDIRDESVCRRLLDGVDGAVHTANLVGIPSGMARDTFFDINVKGTLALVEAAAERADSLERFVHVSSDAVYPMGNHDSGPDYAPIDEDHPKRPAGLYALTKALNEQTVESYHASHSLRTTMIRPAGMFAGAEVLGRWTVGFVVGLLRAAARNPSSGIRHPDLGQATAAIEADASPDDLCAIRDREGRPWLYSPADARGGRRGVQRSHPATLRVRRCRRVPVAPHRRRRVRMRRADALGILVGCAQGADAHRLRSAGHAGPCL